MDTVRIVENAYQMALRAQEKLEVESAKQRSNIEQRQKSFPRESTETDKRGRETT